MQPLRQLPKVPSFGRIVLQENANRVTESDFRFDVTLSRWWSRWKVLPPGEWTRSVCTAPMQQRPPVSGLHSTVFWPWMTEWHWADIQDHIHTRKLCYRKDDRAMRPINGDLKIFESPCISTPTATFPEILMGFSSDRSYECAYNIWSS